MVYKAVFMLASALACVAAVTPVEETVQIIQVPPQGDLIASADESGGGGGGGGGGDGGWGWEAPAQTETQGWGWEAPVKVETQGWGWEAPVQKGWGWPKFKYLKFTIPIPILPRIKFGIKGGLKLNAAIKHNKGWEGWRR